MRIQTLRRFQTALATIVGLLVVLSSPAAHGAESSGRDLVVLVDVSQSMYETESRQPGSDRDRLRWDAVKLVLDFLTDDDRILIVPFNQQSPATDPNTNKIVPGRLAPGLRWLGTKGERQSLEQKVFSFIHNRGLEDVNAAEYNTDLGGTSILKALGYARSQLAPERAANRLTAVVLLTDGKETGEAPLVQSGQWRQDPRVKFFVDAAIPVYTIGLGSEPDRDFLGSLSSMTAGSFFPARTNQELIQVFRSLIWSLNRSWILQVSAEELQGRNTPGIRSRPLEGIIDLGVLMYVADRGRLGKDNPRVTFPPAPPPATQWIGLGTNVIPGQQIRFGKQLTTPQPVVTGYAYYYFDGHTSTDNRPRALFNRRGRVELDLKFNKSNDDLSVFIVKRVAPMFEIDLPASGFNRHEPLPVRVVMQDSPIFSPDQFVVTAALHPPGDVQKGTQATLSNVPETRTFQISDGQLTAAELPTHGGDSDNYTLQVSVSGNPGIDHALSGFRTDLPPRTIEIRNVVPLRIASDEVVLDRGHPRREIEIESLYPMTGELPLTVNLVPPAIQGEKKEIPARHFELSAEDKPLDDDRFVLNNGKAKLTLAFGKELPAGGVVYGPGRLSLSAAKGETPLRIAEAGKAGGANGVQIPFRVRLDTIGLRLSEKALALGVGADRGEASSEFKVELAKEGDSTTGAGKLIVELMPPALPTKSQGTGPEPAEGAFSPEELWIQPAGPPLAAAARKQRIELSQPGENLRVHFHPRPRANDARATQPVIWQVAVAGKGYDSVRSPLTMTIEPPQVALKRVEPVEIHTYPGAPPAEVLLEARLLWLPGGKWSFGLDPADRKISFLRKPDADRKEPATLVIEYEPPAEAVVLDVPLEKTDKTPGWRTIPIRLKIPAKLPAEAGQGTYRGVLELVDGGKTYAKVPIDLSINSLGIRISPDKLALRSSADQAQLVAPVTVELTSPAASSKPAEKLTLAIEPVKADTGAAFAFSPAELWIQPRGPELPADRRKQSLVIDKPGQPLQVMFSPVARKAAGLLGEHQYRLVAKGKGYDDAEGACTAVVDKPELILRHERPLKFQIHPGADPVRVEFQAQLRWLPGGSWSFRPGRSGSTLPFVAEERAGQEAAPPLELGLEGLPDSLMLESPRPAAGAAPRWDSFSFRLTVPQDLESGKYSGVYHGALEFVDDDEVYGKIPLTVELNSLYAQSSSAEDSTERLSELKVVQFFDRTAKVTLRLCNEMDQPLDPAKVKIRLGPRAEKPAPFLAGPRGELLPAPALPKDDDIRLAPDGRGLLIDFHFPEVVNADPGVPYQLDAAFSYHDPERKINLDEMKLRIALIVVDPRAVLTIQRQAPAPRP